MPAQRIVPAYRRAARTTVRALLLALPLALLLATAPRAAQVHALAEEGAVGCLTFTVLNTTDHASALSHYDWVTLRVRNDCPNPQRHLYVAFFFLDRHGTPYGSRIWLLTRGEVLRPGAAKIERYPIPDPENLAPASWAVRVLYLQQPAQRPHGTAPGAAPAPAAQRR